MKKAYIAQPYKIAFQQQEFPVIGPEQVLMKVICTGVCGSDIQTYHGKHKTRNVFPLDFGHEVAGVIVSCGAQVQGYSPGDRVTVEPQQYCGHCYPCRAGRFNVCEKLKVTSVFFREYAVVDTYFLHRCPSDMDFDKIALVEPLAVAIASVKRSKIKDARVCVVGAGTIGNLVAQAALRSGAKDVMITDLLESKLAYARQCGIPHCISTKEQSLAESVLSVFGPDRADVIIDTAATPKAFAEILDAARPHSDIVVTGNYKEPVEFDLTRIQRREVNLLGHMMYVREDFEQAIRDLYQDKIYTKGFIAQRFGLDDMQQAMEFIDAHPGDVMKVMIQIATSKGDDVG